MSNITTPGLHSSHVRRVMSLISKSGKCVSSTALNSDGTGCDGTFTTTVSIQISQKFEVLSTHGLVAHKIQNNPHNVP